MAQQRYLCNPSPLLLDSKVQAWLLKLHIIIERHTKQQIGWSTEALSLLISELLLIPLPIVCFLLVWRFDRCSVAAYSRKLEPAVLFLGACPSIAPKKETNLIVIIINDILTWWLRLNPLDTPGLEFDLFLCIIVTLCCSL